MGSEEWARIGCVVCGSDWTIENLGSGRKPAATEGKQGCAEAAPVLLEMEGVRK